MPKNLTLKGLIEEELMETQAMLSNFIEDMDKVIELIDENEKDDRDNDKIRNEAMSFLLKALEAYSCKAYEDVDRFLHSAIQKLHSQELLDFQDDIPRNKARIALAIFRQKALHNQETISKLTAKLQRIKK